MIFDRSRKKMTVDTILFLRAPFDLSRKNEYKLNNSKLHDAILNNDTKEMVKLLADSKESQRINQQSLLNTPLVLALKQGNIELALLILNTISPEELMLDLQDARGLTALDWACMLRQDAIIKIILSSPLLDISQDEKASILYSCPVDPMIFGHYLASVHSHIGDYIIESGAPCAPITLHEPYTDMIFNMKDLCVNLGWMKKEQFEPLAGASHIWFYKTFQQGYLAFCDKRNAIPVSKDLLEAMKNQENLDNWKDSISYAPCKKTGIN
jgi:ankyrin repeat protein